MIDPTKFELFAKTLEKAGIPEWAIMKMKVDPLITSPEQITEDGLVLISDEMREAIFISKTYCVFAVIDQESVPIVSDTFEHLFEELHKRLEPKDE